MSGGSDGTHPVEAISALIDGELEGEERERVEEHLASCASCRALRDDLLVVSAAFPEAVRSEMPEGAEGRIKARLDLERNVPRRRRLVIPVAVAATLGAMALLVAVQFRQAGRPERAPEQAPALAPARALAPTPAPSPGIEKAPTRAPSPAPPTEPAARPVRPEERSAPPQTPVGASTTAPESRATAVGGVAGPQGRVADNVAEPENAPAAFAPTPEAPAAANEIDAALPRGAPPPAPSSKFGFVRLAEEGAALRAGGARGCPDPWRLPGEADGMGAEVPDPMGAVVSVVRERGGDAVPGADERGTFVTAEVPAAAWPSLTARLRALGIALPEKAERLPEGTTCVRILIRVPSTPPR